MAKDVDISEFGVAEGASNFMKSVDGNEARRLKERAENEQEADDSELDEEPDSDGDEAFNERARRADRGGDDDGDSEDDEDSDEPEDEDNSSKDEAKKESDDPEEVRPPKLYTVTNEDGTQLKLAEDTTIKYKENGKFVRRKLSEILSIKNGEIKHDELIRRASERAKKAEEEDERTKELTKSFHEGITKGDLLEAMGVLGEMTGEDSQKLLFDFVEGLNKVIDNLQGKTREQLEAEATAYKSQAELKKRERTINQKEEAQRIQEVKAEKIRIAKELALEPELMDDAYGALVQRNKQLEEAGKQPINFSMNDIADVAVEFQVYSGIKEIAEAHDVELDRDDYNYLIDRAKIERRKKKGCLKSEDYVNLISEHAGKELSRKVGSKDKTTPKGKTGSKKTSQNGRVKELRSISQAFGL